MCARYHVGYPARNCSSPVAALDPGLPILLGDLNYMKSMNHMYVSRRLEVDGWGGNPQRLAHVGLSAVYDCVERVCRGINGWGGPAVQVGKGIWAVNPACG